MIKIAWSIISQKMVRYVLLPVVDIMNENIKDVEANVEKGVQS